MRFTNAAPPSVLTACSAQLRTVSVISPLFMITVMPRAMPIMAPLAGFANVPSELVVTAYQSANGLVNLVTPTSAVVMGGLAIAKVGYGTWLKFVWPLLVLLGLLTVVVLTVGVLR